MFADVTFVLILLNAFVLFSLEARQHRLWLLPLSTLYPPNRKFALLVSLHPGHNYLYNLFSGMRETNYREIGVRSQEQERRTRSVRTS
jgi:hypothetical protein